MVSIKETQTHRDRDTHKKTVGKRIRKAREDKGLTQLALCKRINISLGTLSDVEKGRLVMAHTLDYHVKLICQELKIDIRSIMD